MKNCEKYNKKKNIRARESYFLALIRLLSFSLLLLLRYEIEKRDGGRYINYRLRYAGITLQKPLP